MRAPLIARVLVPVAVAALSACSGSVSSGSDTVSADELASSVDDKLQEIKDERSEVSDVGCDGEMEAEEGAEQVCHFTDVNDDRYGVTVTVTEVDGSDLSYDLQVDQGQSVVPDELEPVVTEKLTEISGGVAPDEVDCPDELRGNVDETTTCVLTAGEDRLEVTVTVTSAEGPEVEFDIEVADEPLP